MIAEPGQGVRAKVDGHDVAIGAVDGRTIVTIDGARAGELVVEDRALPGAREAIAALRAAGVEPVMITGDREAAARAVADAVGIARVHAGVRPTEKAALVASLRDGGRRVAMVGDGINDAPALATADLGVALASGTDVAAAAADVTLLRGVASLPVALALARATLHVIRRNLAAAFVYNATCIPLAAAGLLSPIVASAAMSASSVLVVLSSLRLRSFAVD